jgi:hypothetical protein
MAEKTQAKGALEKIVSDLGELVRIANEVDQPLLAYLLDSAKLEAVRELEKFRN